MSLSSICSWPDLVEATTLAALSLTVREHSCRRLRWGLFLLAFTFREQSGHRLVGHREQERAPSPGLGGRGQHSLTFEAATSWAVLAAISCEQTMSSSYLPVWSTTLSADSLRAGANQESGFLHREQYGKPPRPTSAPCPPHPTHTWVDIHQLCGSPAHCLRG